MARWIIDAGHGGEDSGYIGILGTKESEITLRAAKELKRLLERNGEKAELVRDTDISLGIWERIESINNMQGDYLVSLHMNSYTDKKVSGTEIYIFEKNTLSEELAKNIRDRLTARLKNNNRGVKEGNQEILRGVKIPAVIVEGEFLSNEEVEKSFNAETYGELVAEGCLAVVNKVLITEPERIPKRKKHSGFRICIGSYKDLDLVEGRLREVKNMGIEDVYLIPRE